MKNVLKKSLMISCIGLVGLWGTAGLTSCEKVEDPNDGEIPDVEVLGEDISVMLSIPGVNPVLENEDVASVKSANHSWLEYTWNEGDAIIAVGYDGRACKGQSELTILRGQGRSTAGFTGKSVPGATEYQFYYKSPILSIDQKGQATMDYDQQIIKETFDEDHPIKEYLFLSTDRIKSEKLASGSVEHPTYVELKMRNAFVANSTLNVKNEELLKGVTDVTFIFNYRVANTYKVKAKVNSTENGFPKVFCIYFDPEKLDLNKNVHVGVQFTNATTTQIVSEPLGNGLKFEVGCATIAMIRDNNDRDLSYWEIVIPANQVWVKSLIDSKPPIPTFEDAPDNEKMNITVSETKNNLGYWVYTADKDITKVPEATFKNAEMFTEVILPEGLEVIGPWAFEGCINMYKIVLPQSLTTVQEEAFKSCSGLSNIIFPENVTKIEKKCFSQNSTLKTITFGSQLESLDDYAFWRCYSLESIIVPENSKLKNIGKKAFEEARCLTNFPNMSKWQNIGIQTFASNSVVDLILPDGCNVGEKAFDNSYDLTTVVIPANPGTLGNMFLYNCLDIMNLTILAKAGNDKITHDALAGIRGRYDGVYTTDYSKAINLYLHKSWNDPTDNENHPTDNNLWLGFTWQSIHFVDDNGIEIK